MADIAASNLTGAPRVPIIVSSRTPEALYKAQHALDGLEDAVVKDPLPIVGGYTAEINAKDLPALMKGLGPGVRVTVDEQRQWIEPEEVASSPADSREPKSVVIPTLGVDKMWDKGFKGQGIGIAVIDTGIYPHGDLKDRIVGFHDFVNHKTKAYDDQGHGTHVSGDAAGSGAASSGKFMGTAPQANLIGVKVLNAAGSGSLSDVVKGIQWAVENRAKYNIRVINMSLGAPAGNTSAADDVICQASEKAVEAGIVTVVAAGNSGPDASTVGTPGRDPKVLTVGALNDAGTIQRKDDSMATFSSRGPTAVDKLVKPDIVTPGVKIIATNAPGSSLDQNSSITHVGQDYIVLSGTSMATPVMAGIVADLLSANPSLTPAQVKEAVMATAVPLEHSPTYGPNDQGSGVVDPLAALARVQGTPMA